MYARQFQMYSSWWSWYYPWIAEMIRKYPWLFIDTIMVRKQIERRESYESCVCKGNQVLQEV